MGCKPAGTVREVMTVSATMVPALTSVTAVAVIQAVIHPGPTGVCDESEDGGVHPCLQPAAMVVVKTAMACSCNGGDEGDGLHVGRGSGYRGEVTR